MKNYPVGNLCKQLGHNVGPGLDPERIFFKTLMLIKKAVDDKNMHNYLACEAYELLLLSRIFCHKLSDVCR